MLENLKNHFGNKIISAQINKGMEEVSVNKDAVHEVMSYLKAQGYDLYLDMCGVDYLRISSTLNQKNPVSTASGYDPSSSGLLSHNQAFRFEVVYHIYSLSAKKRIRVRALLSEEDLKVKSVVDVYPAANWFEREAFDMYGIHFDGHPNLKRLLTWNEFEGHPLRKDYPIDRRQQIPITSDIV